MNPQWTKQRPTINNLGQWFLIKHADGVNKPSVRFKKITLVNEILHLSPESDFGIHIDTIGNPLYFYSEEYTEFAGPIEIPAY